MFSSDRISPQATAHMYIHLHKSRQTYLALDFNEIFFSSLKFVWNFCLSFPPKRWTKWNSYTSAPMKNKQPIKSSKNGKTWKNRFDICTGEFKRSFRERNFRICSLNHSEYDEKWFMTMFFYLFLLLPAGPCFLSNIYYCVSMGLLDATASFHFAVLSSIGMNMFQGVCLCGLNQKWEWFGDDRKTDHKNKNLRKINCN